MFSSKIRCKNCGAYASDRNLVIKKLYQHVKNYKILSDGTISKKQIIDETLDEDSVVEEHLYCKRCGTWHTFKTFEDGIIDINSIKEL